MEIKEFWDIYNKHLDESLKLNFNSLLNTITLNYKYDFTTQVMINKYLPTANACATYEFWKKNSCTVKDIKNGIPMLKDNKITEIFDISQVYDNTTNKTPKFRLFEFDYKKDYLMITDYSKKLDIQIKDKYTSINDVIENISSNAIFFADIFKELSNDEITYYTDVISQILSNKFSINKKYVIDTCFNLDDISRTEHILKNVSGIIKNEIINITQYAKKYNLDNIKEKNIEIKNTKISEKNIQDVLIKHGSGFEDGKLRIYTFFKRNDVSEKEKIAFLKDEFGIGGFSSPNRGDFINSFMSYPKGIEIEKTNGNTSDTMLLSWDKVSNIISNLIKNDKYLNDEEKRQLSEYEKNIEKTLAKNTDSSYTLSSEKNTLRNENKGGDNYVEEETSKNLQILQKFRRKKSSIKRAAIKTEIRYGSNKKLILNTAERRIRTVRRRIRQDIRFRIESGRIFRQNILQANGYTRRIKRVDNRKFRRTNIRTFVEYVSRYKIQIFDNDKFRQTDENWNRNGEYIKRPYRNSRDGGEVLGSSSGTYERERDIYGQRNQGYSRRDDNTSNSGKIDDKEEVEKSTSFFNGKTDTPLFQENIEDKDENNSSSVENQTEKRNSNIAGSSITSPITDEMFLKMQRDQDKLNAKTSNFKITDEILPEKLSPSERLNNNLEAISMLSRIERGERDLDINAQEVLSRYVGWGGLADVFDESKEGQWSKAREFLKQNLSDEEYEAARESTLTAFYTPKLVIDSIYNALTNIGFKGGNILEPSCGIGNFIGNLPDTMANSKFYGVELDNLSGRIAKHLYPESDIQIKGYEQTNFEDNSFDLIIGNVPFGDFKVYDKRYDKENFLIHDYFFAKSIDKLRAGGIIAFITSSGTLDKKDDNVRRYIGQRCNFLGAIRLPDNTFKGVAGTEVVSDIIFLQKREKQRLVHTGLHNFLNVKQDKNGLSYNQYFIDNPQMVLGYIKEVSGRFGNKITCTEKENTVLKEALTKVIENIKGEYKNADKKIEISLLQSDEYKPFSYHIVDDILYYKEDSILEKVKLKKEDESRLKHIVNIRDLTRDILNSQLKDISEYELTEKQKKLTDVYDSYVEKYGYITTQKDDPKSKHSFKKLIEKDVSYPLLLSLEKFDKGEYVGKADLFSKRTIERKKIPDRVDTSMEALILSISEKTKVDFSFMSKLTGFSKDRLIQDLKGEIYLDIASPFKEETYLTKDEYLSGNVRNKAHLLQEYIKKCEDNIKNICLNSYIKENITIENDDISNLKNILNENFNINKFTFKTYDKIKDIYGDIRLYLSSELNIPLSFPLNDTSTYRIINTLKKDNVQCAYFIEKLSEYLRNKNGTFSMNKEDYKKFEEKYNIYINKILDIDEKIIQIQKLTDIAKENLKKMEKVVPEDIKAEDISINLGMTWIPVKYYNQFMYETFKTSPYLKDNIKISYSSYTATFNISGKSVDKKNDTAYLKYATQRTNPYELLEDTLNSKDTNVFDPIIDEKGNKKSILNEQETTLARQKQEMLNDTFKDWIFKDITRRQDLTQIYNEKFNSINLREYDGKNLNFIGMSIEKKLKDYQKNAVAHTLFGGNTLLAHCVGAGKTFEMIASAMESKRLGLCTKSLFVVPGHLTEQTGVEFLTLYPNANILIANEDDFKPKNRKLFTSKIATGNFDAITIGDSQFTKIPMSKEYQEKYIKTQINEIIESLKSLRLSEENESFSIKQLEKKKKELEKKYNELINDTKKDDVVTFEELGIDKLYVDEAHDYKNLPFITKMSNIAGINPDGASKSSDLFMKCRYLDEITNNKGVVFATGTPISNSMAELYTMQRYLQYDELKENGHLLFDSWASQYGQKITTFELAPEGTGFRQRTRFAKYINVPELLTIFKQAADVKTADMLNLPVPNAIYENVVLPPSKHQKNILKGLVERAKLVRNSSIDPRDDNMLKITTDGRKLALDQRLINSALPKDENSKSSICANKVFEIYKNTEDKKSTQVIFCDTSTPANKDFNIYDDIKDELIKKGIKKEEIAFIHDAKTKEKKQELFEKVKKGEVRVIFGSTKKMGTGANIQDKLIALHDLDCPYRPSDLEQRSGRIIRQGNENKDVYIYRYITENSFDAYMYQLLESKQRIISQVMSSKSVHQRIVEDDEIALSYAEIKALATGNPLIKEKLDLDMEIKKLNLLKSQYNKNIYDLQDKISKTYPDEIRDIKSKIDKIQKDLKILEAEKISQEFNGIYIKNTFYADKKEAGEELLKTIKSLNFSNYNKKIGKYMGFDFSVDYDNFENMFKLTLKANHSYTVMLGKDVYGNFTRIDNKLDSIKDILNKYIIKLEDVKTQLYIAKEDAEKPFFKEELLKEKISRASQIEILLKQDNCNDEEIDEELEEENEEFYEEELEEELEI